LLPVVDGKVIPYQPDIAITDPTLESVNPVPTFMLAVANPGSIFATPFIDIVLEFGWQCFVDYEYGQTLGNLVAAQYSDCIYGCLNYTTALTRISNGIGDSIWLCPMRRYADFLSGYFNADVYVAMWIYEPSFFTAPEIDGVIHSAAVPFLFGNSVDTVTDIPGRYEPAEKILSDKFIKAVSNFMRNGNPGPEFPSWIPFEEQHTVVNLEGFSVSDEISQIRTPASGLPGVTSRCDLWDGVFEEEIQRKLDRDTIVKNSALRASIWHRSPIKAHSVNKTLNVRVERGIQQGCPTCPPPPPICYLSHDVQ